MNNMITAIVVDDEKPSREVLCNFLRDYCSDVSVLGTASSVKTAYKVICRHKPDLVFLDIELGDGKGFDLITRFESIDFKIIFVTAYSEHAIRAFRVNAVDYLLKPVKIEELRSAVEKVKNARGTQYDHMKLEEIINGLSENSGIQSTIVISHLKGFEIIRRIEIIMLKADGYCTEFYLRGRRKVVSSKNIKNYEALLTGDNFMRVHNSYIVNLNYVTSCTKQGEIHLEEGCTAFLGDSYKTQFSNKLLKK